MKQDKRQRRRSSWVRVLGGTSIEKARGFIPHTGLAMIRVLGAAVLVFTARDGFSGTPHHLHTTVSETYNGAMTMVAAVDPLPPTAAQHSFEVKSPNGSRNDPYYWLRDDTRKDPDVLAYLAAENAYASKVMAPVKPLEEKLFQEMKSRVQEDDATVPIFKDGYWYYRRFETGKQRPIYARRKGIMANREEILLDSNQLAKGHTFYTIGGYAVSPDGRFVAWADDSVGNEQFSLHIKDLKTRQILADSVVNLSRDLAWANDNKTLFYVGKDSTLRPDRVFRHTLGNRTDNVVFKEDDGQYEISLKNTKSRRFIIIKVKATTSSEVRLIDADQPATPPTVFLSRTPNHLYSIDHLDDRFVMLTNDNAKNFRLVEVPLGKEVDRKEWKELLPHSPKVLLEDFAVYHTFLAVSVRTDGLRKVQVMPNQKPAFYLDSSEPTYAMTLMDTPDADAKCVRYTYDSMTTPTSVFEMEVESGKKKLLKQQAVLGYNMTQYTSEYVHAVAADGTKIPISIVYKKSTKIDGTAPVLVHGYGAYGYSNEPEFDQRIVSLLDRGWVYAIAHIRGGQELGRAWYEDGKLMKKINTFTDFIAATEYLVMQKYGARDQIFAQGTSAGGLLMGAILNLRPDLYRGVVARLPFVDAVTTMLDESIPLTTNEFSEWGNPKEKAAYDYILSYSPYDNVKPLRYPSIYVQAGLWDSRVSYHEPSKWVAKLRATKKDHNLIVMDVNMNAGHFGASGRFDRLKQTARWLAFLLLVHDLPDRR